MECNCKVTEIILGIIILVFAVWPNMFGMVVTQWVVGVAAVLLILHAIKCNSCKIPTARKK